MCVYDGSSSLGSAWQQQRRSQHAELRCQLYPWSVCVHQKLNLDLITSLLYQKRIRVAVGVVLSIRVEKCDTLDGSGDATVDAGQKVEPALQQGDHGACG